MEKYDVIIVGAGIAGCGLAYNLKRFNYGGKVLLIDKDEPGANAAYGYRNTTEEIVKEYDLPYEHVYKGMKVGVADKTYFTLQKKFYFIDYKKTCKNFIKNSQTEFRKEKAINLKKRTDREKLKWHNVGLIKSQGWEKIVGIPRNEDQTLKTNAEAALDVIRVIGQLKLASSICILLEFVPVNIIRKYTGKLILGVKQNGEVR